MIKKIILTSLLVSSVMALEPMQKESGWSGFLLLGVGGMSLESSEVAGNKFLDFENEIIEGRGSPQKESSVLPVLTGTFRYTLDGKKTELFCGNTLEDFLRLDMTFTLGIRHEFDGLGIMGVRLLTTSAPTQVWEDPLLTQTKRTSIDRIATGVGLRYENIMDSNFEVDIRARKITFDSDSNGFSLVNESLAGTSAGENGEVYITSAQQKLLKRKGTMFSIEGLYTYKLVQHNVLIPSIKFTNDNRDGESRDHARTELKLTHLFNNPKYLIASSLYVGTSSFNNDNPIFQKRQDTDHIGGGVNMTYKKPFGWNDWGLNVSVFSARSDSDIDFYDLQLFVASVGLAYSF